MFLLFDRYQIRKQVIELKNLLDDIACMKDEHLNWFDII